MDGLICKKIGDRNSIICVWSTVENCRVKHSELKTSEIEEKFERVFLGPKWGYDSDTTILHVQHNIYIRIYIYSHDSTFNHNIYLHKQG